jgi:hypothetical protein
MPDFFFLIARNFWLIGMLFALINTAIYRSRFRNQIALHPERSEGYQHFIFGYLIVNFLLLGIMGLGITIGGVATVFDFLNPRNGNFFILAFHGTIVALWMVGVIWIFFRGGAEFFVKHPGTLNSTVTAAWQIKIFAAIALLGGVFGELMMWSRTLPPLN